MFIGRTVPLIFLVALTLLQVGCGTTSRFACGAPQGIPCLSVQEVYDRTEFSSSLTGAPGAAQAPGFSDVHGHGAVSGHASAPVSTPVVIEEGSLMLAPTESSPAPVSDALLTDARVIRVWVAPWEDRRGALHMSGYVFSEVQGRRWRVGNTPPASRPVLRLLESTTTEAPASAGAGS
jgi:conjugal transfer pilus assembly protein TraV